MDSPGAGSSSRFHRTRPPESWTDPGMWHLRQLPDADATIVTYCQSGVRNSVAGSALRRKGYNIVELEDSYLGWLDHTNK